MFIYRIMYKHFICCPFKCCPKRIWSVRFSALYVWISLFELECDTFARVFAPCFNLKKKTILLLDAYEDWNKLVATIVVVFCPLYTEKWKFLIRVNVRVGEGVEGREHKNCKSYFLSGTYNTILCVIVCHRQTHDNIYPISIQLGHS